MNFTPLWTAALNAFSNFIIVDEHCRIAYMNKPYTEILNVQLEDVIGKPIKSVIPTTKLPEVMASGKAHIGALMTLYDHKTGKDISFVCNRIPLIEDGEVIGGVAISTFNEVGEIYNLYSEVEKMQQQNELYQQTIEQLRKQTNPLDYIIGTSQAIQQIKSTIAIFANSGLSILLTGETGVGKEVFAPTHCISSAAGAPVTLSRSTVRLFQRIFLNPSFSATKAALLPVPKRAAKSANSNWLTAAHCC